METYYGTYFELLDCRHGDFGNVTYSEVGHIHDVGISHAAVLRKSHITYHENEFEDIEDIIFTGIWV